MVRSRRFSVMAVLCLLSLVACTFQETPDEVNGTAAEAAEASPTDLVGTWVRMWNSYDLDQVEALFITDERVSYFSSEFEGAIQGFQRVLEHHEGFGFVPGGEERDTRLWTEDLSEARFGEMAVLTGIWYFQRGSGEGAAPPQKGPVTFVCILREGEWRFAHMNFGNYLDSDGE